MVERTVQRPRVLNPEDTKPKPSKNLLMLLHIVSTRKWLVQVEDELMTAIIDLRQEVKFIEHLPRCRFCQLTLQLDVERYLGNHSTWYLSLENSEYLEERYRSCPKERNYHIGSYWEQVQYYEKHGNTDVPGENTTEFILDRAKWAYKVIGKQIGLARRLLRMVRTWNFSDRQEQEFLRVYNRLGMYQIALLDQA